MDGVVKVIRILEKAKEGYGSARGRNYYRSMVFPDEKDDQNL